MVATKMKVGARLFGKFNRLHFMVVYLPKISAKKKFVFLSFPFLLSKTLVVCGFCMFQIVLLHSILNDGSKVPNQACKRKRNVVVSASNN